MLCGGRKVLETGIGKELWRLKMLVLKRRPGESVEIPSYGVAIKVARVVDSQSVWLWVDGKAYGPLREGGKLKIGDVTLCVTGFHGSKVKLGFDAPGNIKIMRTELVRRVA
jgi:sRNA-binding carbon storage regulator CsrA